MRTLRLLSVALPVLAVLTPLARANPPVAPPPAKPPVLESVWIEFTSLPTGKAESAVTALRGVGGVREVTWSVANVETRVVREQGKGADADLIAATKRVGVDAARVPVEGRTFQFTAPLHCDGCSKAVRTKLGGLKGTKDVFVPADRSTVTVAYDTRSLDDAKIRAALAAIGKPVKP